MNQFREFDGEVYRKVDGGGISEGDCIVYSYENIAERSIKHILSPDTLYEVLDVDDRYGEYFIIQDNNGRDYNAVNDSFTIFKRVKLDQVQICV